MMNQLTFLHAFISLINCNMVLVCKRFLEDHEGLMQDPDNSIWSMAWIHQITQDDFSTFESVEESRSKLLVLCDIDDMPTNFTFETIQPEISFLFSVDESYDYEDSTALATLRLDSQVFTFDLFEENTRITELYR